MSIVIAETLETTELMDGIALLQRKLTTLSGEIYNGLFEQDKPNLLRYEYEYTKYDMMMDLEADCLQQTRDLLCKMREALEDERTALFELGVTQGARAMAQMMLNQKGAQA